MYAGWCFRLVVCLLLGVAHHSCCGGMCVVDVVAACAWIGLAHGLGLRMMLVAVGPNGQDAFSQEAQAHRRERRVGAQRQLMRQKRAQHWWLVSRRLLTGPSGVWRSTADLDAQDARWSLDSFHDALHTCRRRVPMARCLVRSSSHASLDTEARHKDVPLQVPPLPLPGMPLSLPGIKINKDWNDATSDDEEEEMQGESGKGRGSSGANNAAASGMPGSQGDGTEAPKPAAKRSMFSLGPLMGKSRAKAAEDKAATATAPEDKTAQADDKTAIHAQAAQPEHKKPPIDVAVPPQAGLTESPGNIKGTREKNTCFTRVTSVCVAPVCRPFV